MFTSDGVQLGDEVVGVAAIIGLGDLDRSSILQEPAAFDEEARIAGRVQTARTEAEVEAAVR